MTNDGTPDAEWLAHMDAPSDEPDTRSQAPQPESPSNPTIATIGPPQIFAPLPPVPWTVEGLGLAPGAASVIAGYGFAGKTLIAQSLALSVASGKDLWGVFHVARGRALHLDFEQGDRLTRERYQRLAAGIDLDWRDLGNDLHAAIMPPVYLDDPNAEDVYRRTMDGFSLVVVDSLRAAAPRADENSSDVRRYIDLLSRVAEKTGSLVVFLHHSRKPTEDQAGGAKMAVRGSSAIYDACASVFLVSAKKNEPTRVQHEKDRIRGSLITDFGLKFENVSIGHDPRAGLRVVHLEPEQLTVSSVDREQQLEKRVLDVMRRGSVRSLRQVFAQVGGNKRAVFRLVKDLIEEGTVSKVDDEYRVAA